MKIILSLILFFSLLNIDSAEVDKNMDAELSFANPIGEQALIISNYGMRSHPVLNKKRMHTGFDFQTQKGAQVKASEEGTVIFASKEGLLGNMIVIEHEDGYKTRYAHLESFDENAAKGTEVKKGQVIGIAGKSEFSTNPVLHFEILLNEEPLDPLSLIH